MQTTSIHHNIQVLCPFQDIQTHTKGAGRREAWLQKALTTTASCRRRQVGPNRSKHTCSLTQHRCRCQHSRSFVSNPQAAAHAVPCHGCTLQTHAHMICAGRLAGFPAGVSRHKPQARSRDMQLRTNSRQNGPWCDTQNYSPRCDAMLQTKLSPQHSCVDEAGTPRAVLQCPAKTDAG